MANSEATKKALRTTSPRMTANLPRIMTGESQCSAVASAMGTAARKTGKKEFMERMRAAHPKTLRAGLLPARLRHTRDKPAGGKLSESQARNLESANECPAAAAHFAAIDHASGAGITRQLGEAHIIFLRFELSPERRVFFHGLALAFVAINPGRLRHKGTRKVTGQGINANSFLG